MNDKPTPHYDAVSKRVRQELKEVDKRARRIASRYPDYERNGLTDEDFEFKAMVDYQVSQSRTPSLYFYLMFRDIEQDESLTVQERHEQYTAVKDVVNRYRQIVEVLRDIKPDNPFLCGCIKCEKDYPANDFIRKKPFICARCRRFFRLLKVYPNEYHPERLF